MTDRLLVYGDSLYDTGNLNFYYPIAFDESIYEGGGFKKASDGYTLLEGFLLGLGVTDTPGSILDLESIDIAADGINPASPITNFSIGAATSGYNGVVTSEGVDLSNEPIGLLSQIGQSLPYINQLASNCLDVDVAISIGSNDIASVVRGLNFSNTLNILTTKTKRDDHVLINSVVQTIVDNITGAVQTLKQAGVNEITVLGPQLLGLTPFAKSLDLATGLDFSGFANQISIRANRKLSTIYNNTRQPGNSIKDPDVYFVSGAELDKRYFKIAQPGFVDAVHPNSDSALGLGGFMASLVQENSAFQSFGFA